MERFRCETEILTGPGAAAALAGTERQRVLVVTSARLAENGTAQRICQGVNCSRTEVFPVERPTVRRAVEGMVRLKGFDPDLVIALGDSAVLDCAKAMVCFARGGHRLTAVPTAPGPGTEVTEGALLLHEGRYHLLRHRLMQPRRAILDPELLEPLDRQQWAQGGFAILAAALEEAAGRKGAPMGRVWSRESFRVTWAALSAACAGDPAARHRLQLAGTMAGLGRCGGGTGLCAGLCTVLGGVFSLPPERLCPVILPAVVRCNAGSAAGSYAALARAAGMGGSSPDTGAERLAGSLIWLRRELGLPRSLEQAGIAPAELRRQLRTVVDMALEDPRCRSNPVPADDFLLRRLLESVARE